MSESKTVSGGGGLSILMAIIVGCIAYLQYGTATAVAAYVLISLVVSILIVCGFVPLVGIFIYHIAAKYTSALILTYAGLPVSSSLLDGIIVIYGILAFIICAIMTILVIGYLIN